MEIEPAHVEGVQNLITAHVRPPNEAVDYAKSLLEEVAVGAPGLIFHVTYDCLKNNKEDGKLLHRALFRVKVPLWYPNPTFGSEHHLFTIQYEDAGFTGALYLDRGVRPTTIRPTVDIQGKADIFQAVQDALPSALLYAVCNQPEVLDPEPKLELEDEEGLE